MAPDPAAIASVDQPIPRLGLGTYGRTGEEGQRAIKAALEIGYRHLDTAQSYDTEENVGGAIDASGLPRGEVFVTTKVARRQSRPRPLLAQLRESLDTLGARPGRPDADPLAVARDAVPFERLHGGPRARPATLG